MFVYWIRHKDHTDISQNGYVGISAAVHKRWAKHKNQPPNQHFKNAIQKHGWSNLVKQVIFTGSKEACLAFEKTLRPTKEIGWNLEAGGGLPPLRVGKHPESKGAGNSFFKGFITATSVVSNISVVLSGEDEVKQAGFDASNVYKCLAGKRKTHKGHTFTRITN